MSGGSIADAYSRTGRAWDTGPGRIYDRLAGELAARVPGGLEGRSVLDLGAGTGAASRAAGKAGAGAVVAVDVALGLLAVDAESRPPAVAADARALPFDSGSFDAVVAAFSLNHLVDPAVALAEAARVMLPGGGLAVSAYATDDTHPVKDVVAAALTERGWTPPDWYGELQRDAVPLLATPERAMTEAGGVLPGSRARAVRVALPELDAPALVEWRLGMAHVAPFVATLTGPERQRLVAEATSKVGGVPLVRSMVVLTWRKPR